jgi:hypothetical protein
MIRSWGRVGGSVFLIFEASFKPKELFLLKWFDNNRIDHFHAGLLKNLTHLLFIS